MACMTYKHCNDDLCHGNFDTRNVQRTTAVNRPQRPKWPAYSKESVRRKSFHGTNQILTLQARELAQNGLYYKGYGTVAVCYQCGINLDIDQLQHDIRTAHRERSPGCAHLTNLQQRSVSPDEVNLTAPQTYIAYDTVDAAQISSVISPDPQNGVPRENSILHFEDPDLQSRLLCKVCLNEQISITFQPCGHLAVCHACAIRLSQCPLCRTHITDKIKTFLP